MSMRTVTFIAVAFTGLAFGGPAAEAVQRDAMQECATRVMTRLSKAKASEEQVGAAVVKDCDRQLRAALAEAIKTGEAGGCTVEACLAMARERAAEESAEMYRNKPK